MRNYKIIQEGLKKVH